MGVIVKIKNGKVEVKSEVLKKHPLLTLPIQNVKVMSVAVPDKRISINEWFRKHF